MTKQHMILEILKAIPGTLNVVDKDHNILAVGGEITRTFENTEQIIGKKCYGIFQKRDNPCPWCKVDTVIETGGIVNETTTPDDPREKLAGKPLSVYVRPLKDQDGNIVGAIELGTDITRIRKADEESKLAKQALQESEQKLAGIIESITDAMIMVDKEFNIVWTNNIAKGMFKLDLVGNKCYTAYHGRDRICEPCIVQQCFEDSKVHDFETDITDADGNQKTFWCTASVASWDEEGRPKMVVESLRDVTAWKKANQELREREDALKIRTNELEEANTALKVLLKRRDEDKKEVEEKVLLNVNELVVPYAQKLKQTSLDKRQIAYLNVLESNLINIISPFTHRLSSKALGLTPKEIHVANLVKDGKTAKEIAGLLNVSIRTIESHRKSIRAKIGLKNSRINLRARLLSM